MIIDTEILLRLVIAAIVGGIIGYERKIANKPAGIRTLMLISFGSALFTIVGVTTLANFDPSKIKSFSYRVPTTIVGSADINLVLKKNFNINLILALIKKEIKKQKHKIFSINKTPAISSDFFLNEHSLIYDHNWSTKTKNLFHAVLWYDNENGYSARVVDQLKLISNRKKK